MSEVEKRNELLGTDCELDTMNCDLNSKNEEDGIEKKGAATIRYEDEENDEEKETVSLFISARNTKKVEESKSVNEQENTVLNQRITNKTSRNKTMKSKVNPLVLIVIIPIALVVIIFAAIFINTFISDVNEKVNAYESVENEGVETALNDEGNKALTAEEVVLNSEYYQEFSGITIYYPSEWTLSEDPDHFIFLTNLRTGSVITLYGAPINILTFYNDGKATYQEMAVNLMALDVDNLSDTMGSIYNYTDSLSLGDNSAYCIADFMLNDAKGMTLNFHEEVMLMDGYYLLARLNSQTASYEETTLVYAAITSNMVLPTN